jgi:hypothetical protein
MSAIFKDPDHLKRQTGRSTRMMLEAATAATKGEKVVVLFKDELTAKYWRDRFGRIPGMSIEPMKVHMPELDLGKMRLVGDRATHTLFVDHDILYLENKDLFRAWMKYDLPQPD